GVFNLGTVSGSWGRCNHVGRVVRCLKAQPGDTGEQLSLFQRRAALAGLVERRPKPSPAPALLFTKLGHERNPACRDRNAYPRKYRHFVRAPSIRRVLAEPNLELLLTSVLVQSSAPNQVGCSMFRRSWR